MSKKLVLGILVFAQIFANAQATLYFNPDEKLDENCENTLVTTFSKYFVKEETVEPKPNMPIVIAPPTIIEPIDPPEVLPYENLPYEKVQVFAHYDNCKDLTNEELKNCGMLSIRNEIQKRFKVTPQLRDIGERQGALMEIII